LLWTGEKWYATTRRHYIDLNIQWDTYVRVYYYRCTRTHTSGVVYACTVRLETFGARKNRAVTVKIFERVEMWSTGRVRFWEAAYFFPSEVKTVLIRTVYAYARGETCETTVFRSLVISSIVFALFRLQYLLRVRVRTTNKQPRRHRLFRRMHRYSRVSKHYATRVNKNETVSIQRNEKTALVMNGQMHV